MMIIIIIKLITITIIIIIIIIIVKIIKLRPPEVDRSFHGHFIQSKRYLNVTLRYLMSILSECFKTSGAH